MRTITLAIAAAIALLIGAGAGMTITAKASPPAGHACDGNRTDMLYRATSARCRTGHAGPVRAVYQSSAVSRGSRVTIGANHNDWISFKTAIPRAQDVRVYYDTVNVFPATWPTEARGGWVTLSLRPRPADLLSGKLNARLKALLRSAPAHAELTFWHENEPGNPLDYSRSVNNARTNKAMLEYGEKLVRGTKVKFGQIICAPAIRMRDWIAPGLDWYGVDIFANPNFENSDKTLNRAKLWVRLDNDEAVFRAKTGRRWPGVRFDESNAGHDWHRKNWFTFLAEWLRGHGGGRLLTRWTSSRTKLAGPWPPSKPVIRQLRLISTW